jgi:hypothetical protein
MLRITSPHASFVWLRRNGDGLTVPVDVSDAVVEAVKEHATGMGLSAAEAVSLTRSWLVVEGEHDRAVVEHFFGDELRRSRVGILVLRGVGEARALLQLEHLSQLGKPMFVLFDDTREALVLSEEPPSGLVTREEKVITELRREWRDPNVRLELLSFHWPDVICALPLTAVTSMLDDLHPGKSRRFPGWDQLVAQHTELKQSAGGKQPPGFKQFVFSTLEIPNDADAFVTETLRRSERSSADPALRRQIDRLLAGTDGVAGPNGGDAAKG